METSRYNTTGADGVNRPLKPLELTRQAGAGRVMVLMLWFYLSGLVILLGAELNSEIEHASPHGKNPGEKVPGEKKMLGAAAERDYEEPVSGPASCCSARPHCCRWP